ncbi:2Fe-2S iron-sulfur cluster-binding protein [Pseudophaeobacter sp.]|uniref:2Fe-2S iron-sulfur cluster-binding protein n=1 Tax=Pseudophaeobacter sp. TaxID=1971739 RepID=UPI0040581A71
MKVTWNLPGGEAVTAQVDYGQNLMEAAQAQSVPGIIGDCGGSLACATCHVHVATDWRQACGAPGEFEDAMLDMVDDRQDGSRLSCQIEAAPALDGLVLTVPES